MMRILIIIMIIAIITKWRSIVIIIIFRLGLAPVSVLLFYYSQHHRVRWCGSRHRFWQPSSVCTTHTRSSVRTIRYGYSVHVFLSHAGWNHCQVSLGRNEAWHHRERGRWNWKLIIIRKPTSKVDIIWPGLQHILQNACALIEDSDQPTHPRTLNRDFAGSLNRVFAGTFWAAKRPEGFAGRTRNLVAL